MSRDGTIHRTEWSQAELQKAARAALEDASPQSDDEARLRRHVRHAMHSKASRGWILSPARVAVALALLLFSSTAVAVLVPSVRKALSDRLLAGWAEGNEEDVGAGQEVQPSASATSAEPSPAQAPAIEPVDRPAPAIRDKAAPMEPESPSMRPAGRTRKLAHQTGAGAVAPAAPTKGSPEANAEPDVATPSDDAASLFSAANRKRHEGQFSQAAALFEELLRKHPRARQSLTGRVLLADIYLERLAKAPAALNLYAAYGRQAPRGALALEALAGQARALEAMGKRIEAERHWKQLIEAFPQSAQAERARAALAR